jgi:hypothetical protein
MAGPSSSYCERPDSRIHRKAVIGQAESFRDRLMLGCPARLLAPTGACAHKPSTGPIGSASRKLSRLRRRGSGCQPESGEFSGFRGPIWEAPVGQNRVGTASRSLERPVRNPIAAIPLSERASHGGLTARRPVQRPEAPHSPEFTHHGSRKVSGRSCVPALGVPQSLRFVPNPLTKSIVSS